jgi:DNA-binding transcriptional regulator YiaG
LTQGNAKKLSLVHGLVADAFIGKRPNGCEVAHLNGNPSDNRATNLCYKTKTENERDKATHGTLLRGENTPSRKLSWDQVCEIRQRNASQGTLAERFSVARSTIQRIQSGQYWGAQS